MFELEKRRGNISRCDEKGFRWGTSFSSCGFVFGFEKQHWATFFLSPFGASSLIPLGLIFPPHWKKMCCVLQVCFWIKAALGQVFLSPLRPHAFLNLLGQGFFAPVVLFLPKATLENVVAVSLFFGVEAALDKVVKLRRSQVNRARNLQDEKKNWRTAGENIWAFRTTDYQG